MKMLLRIAVIAASVYALYAGLVFGLQRSVMFPGRRIVAPPLPADAAGMDRYWLTTGSGGVDAWYLPPIPHDSTLRGPALLFFHGNYELIDYWIDEFDPIRQRGFGVMLVEYPGYGRSEGPTTLRTIVEAGVAAYDRLAAREDVDPTRIVLYGRSLGGGPASRVSALRPAAAVVLQSTFSSVRDFTRGLFLPPFLIRDRFDNVAALRDFPGPILIVHGTRDDVIPVDHGRRLADGLPTATFRLLDCAHNDCPGDWATFWNDVTALVRPGAAP